ncbi:NIPSNAP family protein [Endozoicomonas sp. SM1973]|uniref:NIPSNAP family protein n=2 Tax=Spartinivicinus marinus TaxID=2994442 RepID=A0A853I618_9GAMM|nr:NIPSNAP family protein [Spartinivicinus marinus]
MSITCFIEYKINSFKLDKFQEYAENWGKIIPSCGGELIGYFLPHEGSNDIAYGLITFNSLADYEKYRAILKEDKNGKANFHFAEQEKLIISEKRSFLKVVPETYHRLAKASL